MKRKALRNLTMSAILAGGILLAGAGSNVYANSGYILSGGRSADNGAAVQSTGDNGTIFLGGGRVAADNGTLIVGGGRSEGNGVIGSGSNYSTSGDDNPEDLFNSVLEFFFR